MTFIVQGLNSQEIMPLEKLFKPAGVMKTEAITATRAIDAKEHRELAEKDGRQTAVERAYRSVNELLQTTTVLFAHQIMRSPVITLNPEMTINDALKLFHENQFHHLPVVSAEDILVGIVSDRDILRYMGGLSENYQPRPPLTLSDRIEPMMKTPVLTASEDTDVRHIARLFVAQRVGAMPITRENKLAGIITHSDILKAVMSNFVLELWA